MGGPARRLPGGMEASTSDTRAPAIIEDRVGLVQPPREGRSDGRVGDVAGDLGYAERDVEEAAVVEAKASGRPTGQVLVQRGSITEDQLARIMAARVGMPFVDLPVSPAARAAPPLRPRKPPRRYLAVPVALEPDGRL